MLERSPKYKTLMKVVYSQVETTDVTKLFQACVQDK